MYSGLRIRYVSLKPLFDKACAIATPPISTEFTITRPQVTLAHYFDFSNATIHVTPSTVSKVKKKKKEIILMLT